MVGWGEDEYGWGVFWGGLYRVEEKGGLLWEGEGVKK